MNGNNILYRDIKPPQIKDIINYMQIVCDEYGINYDELKTESTQRFTFILNQCGTHFFKYSDFFKTNNSLNVNNNNIINVNRLLEYINIYIIICDIFNKIPSALMFATFCAIDYEILLNPVCADVLKKINTEREQRLVNTLEDGKKNPVGTIAILNKCYSWDKETRAESGNDRKTLSVNDLKDIFTTLTPQKRIE